MRIRLVMTAAVLTGVFVTVLVLFVPAVDAAYKNASLHVALETAEALIALFVAFLLFGRFRNTRSLGDLTLVYVMLLFALTNIFLSIIPTTAAGSRPEVFATWAPLTLRLIASGAFACAALSVRWTGFRVNSAPLLVVGIATGATLIGVALLAGSLNDTLPAGVEELSSSNVSVEANPVLLNMQLVLMGLFGAAAVGFVRTAQENNDELLAWVAVGATLAAFARLNYFMFPSIHTDYVYTGDVLRLGFYLALLTGAFREISSFWRGLALAAVGQERQRVARGLHDGVAQQLVYISAQSRRALKGRATETDLRKLAGAADRAVFESRRAIAALGEADDPRLDRALRDVAEQLLQNSSVETTLRLDPVEASSDRIEGILRVLREAVVNAVAHGEAHAIEIMLRDGDQLILSVTDDGSGFDVAEGIASGRGFGIGTMQERARALGGEVTIESAPGRGTSVQLRLPAEEGADSEP